MKTKDDSAFTLLKLPIDQILHIIKHRPWVSLSKPSKHDPDSQEVAGHCSLNGIQEHATLYCWARKRYSAHLVQRVYLNEFVLNQEEESEVGDILDEAID